MRFVSMRGRYVILAALLILSFFFLFNRVRKVRNHPDLKGMAVTGFAHDLISFLKVYQRFPRDWNEYGEWYKATFPYGRRQAEWAKDKFEILLMGKDVSALGPENNDPKAIKIIKPEWKASEDYLNMKLNCAAY